LSNAARSKDSVPDAFVDVTVPLQLNRSEMSFSTKLNFPFLIGIWNPEKLNPIVITSPVTGQRSIMVVKNGSNFGPPAV
jgi:hypothetical protein